MAKAKLEVVVATRKGAICQRRTYRFEDSVHQFFRRLQSVMEVDMLEAEDAVLIYVDGRKINDWEGTIMGDIIDVDSMFMVVLSGNYQSLELPVLRTEFFFQNARIFT